MTRSLTVLALAHGPAVEPDGAISVDAARLVADLGVGEDAAALETEKNERSRGCTTGSENRKGHITWNYFLPFSFQPLFSFKAIVVLLPRND